MDLTGGLPSNLQISATKKISSRRVHDFIAENEAILFYYTNEMKIPKRTEDVIPYFCGAGSYPENDRSSCSEYDGYKKFNITGVYLNARIDFSITLLSEKVWDQPYHTWRAWRNIPSWTDIQIASNGRHLDMFYNDETRGVSSIHLVEVDKNKRYRKRVLRNGYIQTIERRGTEKCFRMFSVFERDL